VMNKIATVVVENAIQSGLWVRPLDCRYMNRCHITTTASSPTRIARRSICGAPDEYRSLQFQLPRRAGDTRGAVTPSAIRHGIDRAIGRRYTLGLPKPVAGSPMPRFRNLLERRDTDRRPANGDTTRCPQCGGLLEFSERFRVDGRPTAGWLCDNAACPVRRFPAAPADTLPPPTSHALVRMSRDVQAKALRTVMKSKARVGTHARKRHG
jgi:hypothetical protein